MLHRELTACASCWLVCSQVRICQRMNVQLVSTPFEDRNYYNNIRKALVAGYFMQVCVLRAVCLLCFLLTCLLAVVTPQVCWLVAQQSYTRSASALNVSLLSVPCRPPTSRCTVPGLRTLHSAQQHTSRIS